VSASVDGRPPGTTAWTGSITEAGSEMRSYYGRPVLKEPVWKPQIPVYMFTGGLGGASAALSLAARAVGNEPLARTSLYVGAAADAVSPVLLITDLGRPERFLNMFRVFKPTSPMSVGSWLLGLSGTATGLAATLEAAGRAPRAKLALECVAALLGPPLATYTATLVSDTAVPAWHEARHELPFVFAGSAASSAGAAATLLTPAACAGPARRLAIGGAALKTVALLAMQKRLGFVGEPYKAGPAGVLTRLSKALTVGGATALALSGRRGRGYAIGGASALLAADVLVRWGVFRAGFQSARDPRYTVEPQRERLEVRRA
jgi:polysulfide reductase-like protein